MGTHRHSTWTLPENVLDAEGYIIDQGNMGEIPFGWFSTKEKGCGWIAAYNLLKMNGLEEPPEQVLQEVQRFGFPGKMFGQEVVWLLVYLQHKGFRVHLSRPGYKGCEDILDRYPTGILMYLHRKGAHYAAYHAVDAKTVHLYNAIYQKRNHIVPIRSFLEVHTVLHGCIIIGCRPRVAVLPRGDH